MSSQICGKTFYQAASQSAPFKSGAQNISITDFYIPCGRSDYNRLKGAVM